MEIHSQSENSCWWLKHMEGIGLHALLQQAIILGFQAGSVFIWTLESEEESCKKQITFLLKK